jgi:poly(A) polymerase
LVEIPRPGHCVSRDNISSNALKVLYRLRGAGFRACLVGGSVRDLLLGREPKDFDVVTDAHPDQIQELFRNCRLIGRRFRLAHVRFGREIIEVATFRALHDGDTDEASDAALDVSGRIVRDNVYGTIEEDALRRDFTVNALYYDINNFSVLDYANGVADLEQGLIRLIGDPETRYREDPVRMLRAVRFAAKLGFRLHPETEAPVLSLRHLLADIPSARLFDEVLKLFLGGCAVQTFEALRHFGLFGQLFPATEASLSREEEGFPHMFVVRALANTDTRISEGKPVTPAFLFAALLWEPMREATARLEAEGLDEYEALAEAAEEVTTVQLASTSVPRRFSIPMREIWMLQPRLRRIGGKRAERLVANPRFRAAYDFMLLRNEVGEPLQELCDWWTAYQEGDASVSQMKTPGSDRDRERRRRRPRRRRRVVQETVS